MATKKTDTKKADTKKADTKKADTKKADTKKADTKKAAGGVRGEGTAASPWKLQTPPLTSQYEAYRDPTSGSLVVQVGATQLRYQLRCIEDLRAMLKAHGDWMPLGSADEQKEAAAGTVEAWGRSADNPVGGWYGTKKGLRGRFGMYVPPVLEALGLAELEHNPKNNRMRAK
jgi:hypothetical protein